MNISRTGQYIENKKQTSLIAIPAALKQKKIGKLLCTNKKL